jgi:lipoprotein-anchoring transpeptidase ErfK/SrfK
LGLLGKFQRWYDWTDGCIALTNEEIDELYAAVKIGTPIEIKP